ncbi:MAG: hypothetical protein ABII00_06445 [Elusimicrobiota bacterium]
MQPEKPFPEVGSSVDPKIVPWQDSVVWSERTSDGRRVYEWLTKEHIRSVGWTNGLVSVQIADASFLARDLIYFVIQAPFVTIGRNVSI